MEKRNTVDVSILTANYNNGNYISELINSVLLSTFLPVQFIIVDDGSIDNSVSIIKQYAMQYDFIELVELIDNRGFANALNVGLNRVKGRFVMRVDSDDYISNDRIEKQYQFMNKNSNIGVVGSNIRYFNSHSGQELFSSHVSIQPSSIKQDFLNMACGIIHGSTMIRTSIFKQYSYFQDSVPAEDYELFSKMLKNGVEIRNLSEELTYVRIHVKSVSNSLPYKTIEKTSQIAKNIWGIDYPKYKIIFKYIHLKYYRKFLFEPNVVRKNIYVIISLLFCPSKIVKRLYKS